MIRYNLPCLYPCGGIGGDSMIRYNLPCLYPRGGIGGDAMKNDSAEGHPGVPARLRLCADILCWTGCRVLWPVDVLWTPVHIIIVVF